jgi:DNA-directed RNA polymerase subunit E'/Rpb7
MSLVGKHTKRSFTIGEKVKVRIDSVDMEEREIIVGICNH